MVSNQLSLFSCRCHCCKWVLVPINLGNNTFKCYGFCLRLNLDVIKHLRRPSPTVMLFLGGGDPLIWYGTQVYCFLLALTGAAEFDSLLTLPTNETGHKTNHPEHSLGCLLPCNALLGGLGWWAVEGLWYPLAKNFLGVYFGVKMGLNGLGLL